MEGALLQLGFRALENLLFFSFQQQLREYLGLLRYCFCNSASTPRCQIVSALGTPLHKKSETDHKKVELEVNFMFFCEAPQDVLQFVDTNSIFFLGGVKQYHLLHKFHHEATP